MIAAIYHCLFDNDSETLLGATESGFNFGRIFILAVIITRFSLVIISNIAITLGTIPRVGILGIPLLDACLHLPRLLILGRFILDPIYLMGLLQI